MSDKPFIKFFPSDFLAGTSGLSPAERGIYITLLCLIFENDGPIPRDDGRLARRCGLPKGPFKRTLDALLDQGKMLERDGMLTNRRAETALIDRQVRSKNGTNGAVSRWAQEREKNMQKQGTQDATAMREDMQAQCVSDASQSPESRDRDSYESLSRAGACETEFQDFWKVVPKQVGKAAAERAYRKARKITDAATLFASMKAYAETRDGEDPKYTANPVTWLEDERWRDRATKPASYEDTDEFQSALEDIRRLQRERWAADGN